MLHKNLVKNLCLGGLVPFYLLPITIFFNYSNLYIDLFSLYSLVILSFLCGSTWYHLIINEKKNDIKLLICFIVLLPIILLFIEIIISDIFKIFIFALSYFVIFVIDKKYYTNIDYLFLRKVLTIFVIISHIILLIGIYTNGL